MSFKSKRFVQFTQPYLAEVESETLSPLTDDDVLVETHCSGISAGTELLVYRGELPEDLPIDATIESLEQQGNRWPIRYGYSAVGRVAAVADKVRDGWLDQRVLAFNPHESCFAAHPTSLITLPDLLSNEDAIFLPNMETAVSFVMDGAPMIGEKVVILGLGIVGQLTAQLLSRYPLSQLIAVDGIKSRRELAKNNGNVAVFEPDSEELSTKLGKSGADLVFELSGNPKALDMAVKLAGYSGRVVIGSWYGKKQAPVDFGGHFHRSNMTLIASQVSQIHPGLSGRWTKRRRLNVALKMLQQVRPAEKFISHRADISAAQEIYQMLDQRPEEAMQVVFTY